MRLVRLTFFNFLRTLSNSIVISVIITCIFKKKKLVKSDTVYVSNQIDDAKIRIEKKTGSIEPKHTTFESYHILTALEEYGVLVEI